MSIYWETNTEPDLSHYAVYRGLDEEFVPAQDNLIGATIDNCYFDADWRSDSDFYYKVSAFDVHGNESSYSVLTPANITGVVSEKLPVSTVVTQNYPNPFNLTTTSIYQVSKITDVELMIFNQLGQKIRTLVDGRQPAGRYKVQWDGRDQSGTAVSSGVYIYRFKAGACIQSRKMILMR